MASMDGDMPGEFIIMKLLSTPSTVKLLSCRRWPFDRDQLRTGEGPVAIDCRPDRWCQA